MKQCMRDLSSSSGWRRNSDFTLFECDSCQFIIKTLTPYKVGCQYNNIQKGKVIFMTRTFIEVPLFSKRWKECIKEISEIIEGGSS